MKKRLLLVLTMIALMLTLVCVFASCNNGDNANEEVTPPPPEKTAAEKVEDMIDAINDADSCYEATKAYYALTKEEQKALRNWSDLPFKMSKYIDDTRVRDYYMQWTAQVKFDNFHDSLRNKLLNINSYTVNNETAKVFYDASAAKYYLYIKVDYSAQNKAGGYTRYENNANYFVWETDHWRELRAWFDEDGEMDIIKKIYTWEYPEYKTFSFKYSAQ